MIDVIIPAYNAKETIIKTLASIAYQNIHHLLNVYIVNDCSDYSYNNVIKIFKNDLNIKELTLKENKGPGVARQYGIDNSNSEYIVFIDADDLLYDSYTLFCLYNTINTNNTDLVMSISIDEHDNREHQYDNGNLHGKIYRRKFLEYYNIRFNDMRFSEDNGFNQLILLLDPKINYLNKITYIYTYNNNSVTEKKLNKINLLENYIKNFLWAVEESKKHKEDRIKIAYLLFNAYAYIYCMSYDIAEKDYKKLKKIETEFSKYEESLGQLEQKNILGNKLEDVIFSNIKYCDFYKKVSFEKFREILKK